MDTRTPPPVPTEARGAAVSVEHSITDEPGFDDDFEYHASNQTVEVVFLRTGDSVSTKMQSLAEWARPRSIDVGERRVVEATRERLGSDEFDSGVAAADYSWNPLDEEAISVARANTTAATLWALVDAAPSAVDVTIDLEGDTFSRTIPVFVTGSVESQSNGSDEAVGDA